MGTTVCTAKKSKRQHNFHCVIEKNRQKISHHNYITNQMIEQVNTRLQEANKQYHIPKQNMNVDMNDQPQMIKFEEQNLQIDENDQIKSLNSPPYFKEVDNQIIEMCQEDCSQQNKIWPLDNKQIQIPNYNQQYNIEENTESPVVNLIKSNIRMTQLNNQLKQLDEEIQYELQNDPDYRFIKKRSQSKSEIQSQRSVVPQNNKLTTQSQILVISQYDCFVCSLKIEDPIFLECYHAYHQNCFNIMIKKQIDSGSSKIICQCGIKISLNLLKTIIEKEEFEKILELQCKKLEATYKDQKGFENLQWKC